MGLEETREHDIWGTELTLWRRSGQSHLEGGVGHVTGATLGGRLRRSDGEDGEDAGVAPPDVVGGPAQESPVVQLSPGAVAETAALTRHRDLTRLRRDHSQVSCSVIPHLGHRQDWIYFLLSRVLDLRLIPSNWRHPHPIYHRDIHAVDAVVEAPGEEETLPGVGEDVAVDVDDLELVGLVDSLGPRPTDGSVWREKLIIKTNSHSDTLTLSTSDLILDRVW